MGSVKYIRPRPRSVVRASPRRVSTRVGLRRSTTTDTLRRPKGFKQSRPQVRRQATRADTSARRRTTAVTPKSQDYLESDELIGWKYYPSTKRVDVRTRRSADGSERLVPEKLIQQRCPSRLYNFWGSFSQPREKTIKTNHYHVFDIIGEDPGRGLKVQWVGYSPSENDTTWEPMSKIRKMDPRLFHDYVTKKQISEGPARG
ncbi:hypothetical protein LZ32DRAFT_612243 [Colletotrichum eremochloae]|nr:hypothetical protein LZ32DRAFT_612243 [Colletotrichum eremochloae]